MAQSAHRWHFFRAGDVDQVAIRDASDLARLPELDPKLWAALAMPTRGIEIDSRTLDLLDTDKDGRVRQPEMVAAIRFMTATLADAGEIVTGGDGVAVAAIKDARIQAAAKRALAELGRADQKSIALADVADHAAAVAKLKVNGDGVLPPDSADDAETQKLIGEIIDVLGGVADRSGEKGVDQATVDKFFTEAQALVDWYQKREGQKELLPLGDATGPAAGALAVVRAKIDDYFTRARLAAFDPRAQAALNGAEADFAAIAAHELAPTAPEVARLPLARVEPARPLALKEGLNPAWAGSMATFVAATVTPLLGARAVLTEGDWAALQERLAAYEAWAATKPVSPVEKLGLPRLREVLGGDARARLTALIAKDKAQEDLNQEVVEVERLLQYKRDLFEILQNFVNFSRFYRHEWSVFQAGTLYVDGRSCDLCVEVADAGKHAALAAMADSYLAYCDIVRAGEKKTVVVAITGGDGDNIFVGRNGVFFDRKGRDWDATVTKVVANPISVREAFWAPYKKFARLIEEQFQKRAQAADAESQAALGKGAAVVAQADKAPAPPAPKKIDVGTVAAIGVAVGGIGAMVAGILSAFFGLGVWMPIGVVALILLISGPSMLLALLKLRRRNLGPLLDANGWAINGRARINVPFGGALTRLAAVPRGSIRSFDDPFAERRRPWRLYVTLAILVILGISWYVGKLDPYLPKAVRSATALDRQP